MIYVYAVLPKPPDVECACLCSRLLASSDPVTPSRSTPERCAMSREKYLLLPGAPRRRVWVASFLIESQQDASGQKVASKKGETREANAACLAMPALPSCSSISATRFASLAASLLILYDFNSFSDKHGVPAGAVTSRVTSSVIIQVVSAGELVLAAELASKSIRSFTVQTKIRRQ